jgi:carbamoylphosphate synthase large subunit
VGLLLIKKCEGDYPGTEVSKALLKEEGYEIVI